MAASYMGTGYISGGIAPGPSAAVEPEQPGGLWDLSKCRRAYTTYLDSKRLEIEEQQMARRYRHGVQWTARADQDAQRPQATGRHL